MELLAYLTPVLIVAIILSSLIVLGVILHTEFSNNFNNIFELVNGEEKHDS